MKKKCCYLDRECAEDCIAYLKNPQISAGLEEAGIPEMKCLRLFAEVSQSLKFDFEEEWEEE